MKKVFKKWSKEEINYIKKYANEMSAKDIGLKIERSERSVSEKLRALGIHKIPKRGNNKGYNDNLYIGKKFGVWEVIRRENKNNRQPYFECVNNKGETKSFRQDCLAKLSLSNKSKEKLKGFKETKYKGVYANTKGEIVRVLEYPNGRKKTTKYSPTYVSTGYLGVCISIDGIPHSQPVHRLIAETFIPNPDNLPQVNHKNEIKTDNRVENLEWCTHKYNVNYGTRTERAKKSYYENRIKKQKGLA